MTMLWTGLTLGLLGSLHCVGMCGAIALSLPYQGKTKWQTIGNMLWYNFGRVLTYALMGSILGGLGHGIVLAGFQQGVSIVLGGLLLLTAFSLINLEKQILQLPLINQVFYRIRLQLGRLLQRPTMTYSTLLGMGLLNGLLPCGLVYVALAGAMTTGTSLEGFLYMALFGIGTIPLMLLTATIGRFMGMQYTLILRKWTPVFLAGFAILLIMRGLDLGIPFISPDLVEDTQQEMKMCH